MIFFWLLQIFPPRAVFAVCRRRPHEIFMVSRAPFPQYAGSSHHNSRWQVLLLVIQPQAACSSSESPRALRLLRRDACARFRVGDDRSVGIVTATDFPVFPAQIIGPQSLHKYLGRLLLSGPACQHYTPALASPTQAVSTCPQPGSLLATLHYRPIQLCNIMPSY